MLGRMRVLVYFPNSHPGQRPTCQYSNDVSACQCPPPTLGYCCQPATLRDRQRHWEMICRSHAKRAVEARDSKNGLTQHPRETELTGYVSRTWSKITILYLFGSKKRRDLGDTPPPGPPCKNTAGMPSGLPETSYASLWPSPTSSIPSS